MKASVHKARRLKRLAGRALKALVIAAIAAAAAYWARPYYPAIDAYLKSFGRSAIDTAQIDGYYDLLKRHARPSATMVLGLGQKKGDKADAAIERLKGAMGLSGYKIWLAHHDAEKPPAYIKQLGYGDMGILVSRSVKEEREVLNLLVHELGHIYVWDLKGSVFAKCDQEKLNDCAGAYLGLGVVMLNGFTNEFGLLPGEGYESKVKEFGYLKPEQVGYLTARYCAEHAVPPGAVRPFLNRYGRRYFDRGLEHLRRSRPTPDKPAAKVTGLCWCPACGARNEFALGDDTSGAKCARCGGRLAQ